MEEEIIRRLDEIAGWLRFQNREQMKQIVEGFTEDELVIYHLADGNHSIRDIEKHIEGSRYKVNSRLKSWNGLGIIQKTKDGQWMHICPLSALGIEPPYKE